MLVVLFHMNIFTIPDSLGRPPLWGGLNMGYAGVEIFFVLSGFIMYYVHSGEFGRPDRFGLFVLKRVTRIYPFFWIVLSGVVLLRMIDGAALPTSWSLFVSATLLPFQEAHILGVQWTLSFEMMFYLVFGVTLLNRYLGLAVGGIWFAACATAAVAGYGGPGAGFLLSAYNLLFLFGLLAAYLWTRLGRGGGALLGSGALLFFGVGLSEAVGGVSFNKSLRTVLYGLGAMAMIMALVSLEAKGKLRTPRWLAFLGDASYAIYLVHITAMAVIARVLQMASLDGLPSLVLGGCLFLGAVAAGAAAHVLLEKPLTEVIRRQTRPKGAATGSQA